MAEKVQMIALSPTMETGTLVKWRKKQGETVKAGDVICEVETDKATMDYESSAEGVLLKILLPEGGQAKIGDLIAIIGKDGEDISALLAEPSPPAPDAPVATRGAPAPVVTANAPSPAAATGAQTAQSQHGNERIKTSPLARRLAAEKGLDIAQIPGSGPGGRVVRRDLEAAARGAAPSSGPGASPAPAAARAAVQAPQGARVVQPAPGDQVIPLSGMRKTIARRVSESMFSAPHIYLTVTATVDALLKARQALNAGRQGVGGPGLKVSVNAFLMKLAAEALKKHPVVNSSWNGDSILRRGSIDIGLAVALPDGLITPVVRNCGAKGVLAIDAEISDLVDRARKGKLAPAEYTDGSFTISNLGSFGIEEFTAIINPPASAILAVGQVRKEPVVEEEDRIAVHQRMRMTLSCDHRVIDGAMGAAFLSELVGIIEDPFRILF